MKSLLFVGLGSMIGGMLRYLISVYFQNKHWTTFPWATFAVNIIGCFCIGLVFGYGERMGMSKEIKLFLGTGLLGGFTTFSAFSLETVKLVQAHAILPALCYIAGSLIFGLTLTYFGYTHFR